jgi:hypothetical protein
MQSALRITSLLLLCGLATGAAAQDRVSAGAGITAGILGIEVQQRGPGPAIRLAAIGGVAGLGARIITPLGDEQRAVSALARARYVSVGYLLTPWRVGSIDGTGAAVAEVGFAQIHPDRRLVADLALGILVVHGGSWGGYAAGPTLRLQLGILLGQIP